MILLEYKKISETPLECINRMKDLKKIGKEDKSTYAGRLDPMANGLMMILTNKDTKKKDTFNNLNKEYEFEILQNIHTDSLDILGIIDDYKINTTGDTKEKEILNFIKNLCPQYKQRYPKFSSKTFEGVQLHNLAKNNIFPELYHLVKIDKIDFISKKYIKTIDLKKNIIEKVKNVNGDFRQEEIINSWEKILNNYHSYNPFIIYKFRIKVSSGFYIRQLVDDISSNFQTPMITYSIKRVSLGKYTLSNYKIYNVIHRIRSLFLF